MHPRRPLLKRVAVWTAAVVLLLAGYVGSAPFVVNLVLPRFPAAEPAIIAIYAPLLLYTKGHPNWPGNRAFVEYEAWCRRVIGLP